MENRRKVYVAVNADFDKEGAVTPREITFEDGARYAIEGVTDVRRAASTRVGGLGVRYTITIFGRATYLFHENSNRWFVEAK